MTVRRAIGLATCAAALATVTAATVNEATAIGATAFVAPTARSTSAIANSPAAAFAQPITHSDHSLDSSLALGVNHRGTKAVTYLGRGFAVPYSWPVFDLTAHPTTCVRFDVHAVYLGRPSGEQQCPAHGAGRRTGALLIEPDLTRSTSTGMAAVVLDHPISAEIDVTAPGLTITASYGDDRATVVNALTAAGLPPPSDTAVTGVTGVTGVAPSAPSPATLVRDTAPVEIVRGTNQVTGLGFDTCTAPSAAQMAAWAGSPFNTVGIYIGGSERACGQASLTADWLIARAKTGWHFMPIYVGWQAAWDTLTATASSPGPAVLGTRSADDAIAQARGLGIGPGALLYYDMESYTAPGATAAAMAFLSAWTAELHAKGYRSAVYSSAATGIADLVAYRGKMTEPDVVAIAQWNGIADADLTATPADAWPAQRAHQYTGGEDVTYGGVKLNIDKDYLSINNTAAIASPAGTGTSPAAASGTPSLSNGANGAPVGNIGPVSNSACPNGSASPVLEPSGGASNRLIAC